MVFPLLRAARFAVVVMAFAPCAEAQGFHQWTWVPPSTAHSPGAAVAFVGDENGDGVPDVLIGVPAPPAVLGPPAPYTGAIVLSGADGTTVLKAYLGSSPTTKFGYAVADAGDLDLDGVTDFLITEPGVGVSTNGAVHVYSGLAGTSLFTITGSLNDSLGTSVAGGTDYDLDGIPDIVCGAPGALFPAPNFNTGRVLVCSGVNGGVLRVFTATGAFQLGTSVANVGDMDGDNRPDVLAGAPGSLGGFDTSLGTALVFSWTSGVAIHTINGTLAAARYGYSVAGLGDVDGDVVPDFVVGAPRSVPPSYLPLVPGWAEVRSGASGGLIRTLAGSLPGDDFGASVANAGDIDGDGISDVVVGAPRTSTNLVLAGRVAAYSGLTGAPLLDAFGAVASGYAGTSVAGGADVTGDGVPDVAFGAPGYVTIQLGRVSVVSAVGTTGPGLMPYGTSCPGTGGFAPTIAAAGGPATLGNATFGISVSRGLGGTAAYLFVSSSAAPFGFPIGGGCNAWLGGVPFQVGPTLMLAGPAGLGGAGHRIFPAPVPSTPALSGATFYLEWGLIDPAASTGAVSVSDALAVTVQ